MPVRVSTYIQHHTKTLRNLHQHLHNNRQKCPNPPRNSSQQLSSISNNDTPIFLPNPLRNVYSPPSWTIAECTGHCAHITTCSNSTFRILSTTSFPAGSTPMPPSSVSREGSEPRNPMLRLVRAVVPRRVFRWLYSFSLAIFVVLTTVFVITSPLDIAVQTWLARLLGIKLLVIFAACALMLVLLFLLYFTRLYKYRVAINHIPARSAYVPLARGDMAREVLAHVERGLQWCVGDVLRRAGPLPNRAAELRYPGMAPPEYIQHRNVSMGQPHVGNFFPPNCVYEDVVDSLGLRLRCEGFMLTTAKIPCYYTMRETLLSEASSERARAQALQMARLYESLKYGPDLIREQDLAALLVALDRLLLDVIGNHPLHPLLDNAETENKDSANHSLEKHASPRLAYPETLEHVSRLPLLHPPLLYLPFHHHRRRRRLQSLLHSGHSQAHSDETSTSGLVVPYGPLEVSPSMRGSRRSLARTNTRESVASRSTTGSVIKARLAYTTASRTSSRALYLD